MQLADVNPNGNSVSQYSFYYEYNNEIFFNTVDPSNASINKLMIYNPESGQIPTEIKPENTTFTDVANGLFINIFAYDDNLYLDADYEINNVTHGAELWKITPDNLNTQENPIINTLKKLNILHKFINILNILIIFKS